MAVGVQIVSDVLGGVQLVGVYDNSPAKDMRLKTGDVICSVDGVIMGMKIDHITLVVYKDKAIEEIQAKLIPKKIQVHREVEKQFGVKPLPRPAGLGSSPIGTGSAGASARGWGRYLWIAAGILVTVTAVLGVLVWRRRRKTSRVG